MWQFLITQSGPRGAAVQYQTHTITGGTDLEVDYFFGVRFKIARADKP